MKNIFSTVILAAALFFSISAQAAVSDGTPITNEELRPLAAWVAQATGIKIGVLPIATASGRQLKTSLGLMGAQQARSMAAYIPGRIIVNNIIWDPESDVSKSYVVHEMVHHAQTLSGKHYVCNNAKEREAYELQNRWLAEHGEEPIFSDSWISSMSNCR